jgi:hypothetical protein
MNLRAVGTGVLGGILVIALQFVIAFGVPLERYPDLIRYVLVANQLLSIATYAVAGAVAGNYARRRGALHGLAAGFATAVAGRVFGMTLSYLRYGIDAVEAALTPWQTLVILVGIGLVIATVAGAIGARIALRRRPA